MSHARALLFRSLTAALLLTPSTFAATTSPQPAALAAAGQCVPPAAPGVPQVGPLRPLPSGVAGQVAFYAAIYTAEGQKTAEMRLGDVDRVYPLASAFKTTVVHQVLQDVDAGRLRLDQMLETTAANRSIEAYPPGRNSVLKLIKLAIGESDNTASDILHLQVTPSRLTANVRALSPCTSVLMTTKGLWSLMAGLVPQVVSGTTPAAFSRSAQAFGNLTPTERLKAAGVVNQQAQRITAPTLLKALDRYFLGSLYQASNDAALYNTSTARAYADLTARLLRGTGDLRPATQTLYRQIMTTGCCTRSKTPLPFTPTYWGAKAGSGWGLLTMSGYMELPDGRNLAYMYINHDSPVRDSELIERQIYPVNTWILNQVNQLRLGAP